MCANIHLETGCHSQMQDTRTRVKVDGMNARQWTANLSICSLAQCPTYIHQQAQESKSNYLVLVQFNYVRVVFTRRCINTNKQLRYQHLYT